MEGNVEDKTQSNMQKAWGTKGENLAEFSCL
jgi:hypothetical protein